MEVDTKHLLQLIGGQAVELSVLRDRVRTLEAALAVATKKPEPEKPADGK